MDTWISLDFANYNHGGLCSWRNNFTRLREIARSRHSHVSFQFSSRPGSSSVCQSFACADDPPAVQATIIELKHRLVSVNFVAPVSPTLCFRQWPAGRRRQKRARERKGEIRFAVFSHLSVSLFAPVTQVTPSRLPAPCPLSPQTPSPLGDQQLRAGLDLTVNN